MSRAFTKEIDDAPVAPEPDRPISSAPNFVTPRGAELIEGALGAGDAALASAQTERERDALRRDQRYWAARRASMQIVPATDAPEAVAFGVTVDLIRQGRSVTVRIVGEDEADPSAGLIAWTSPLARAIEGAERGETIPFEAGGRVEEILIKDVRP